MKRSFLQRLSVDVLGRGAMFALTILLARILGVEEFGKLVFAISYAGLAAFLSEFGTHLLFLRELGGGKAAQKEAVWEQFLGLKAVLSLGVLFLGSVLSFWAWPWDNPMVLVVMVAWAVGNSFMDFLHQACNGMDRIGLSAAIMTWHRSLCLGAASVAAALTRDIFWTAGALAVGSLLGLLFALELLRRRLGFSLCPRWRPLLWGRWLKMALPLAAANIFGSSYVRLGILMLPWLGRQAEAGFFGAAFRLFEAGYLIPAAYLSVGIPRLSRDLAGDKVIFHRNVRKMAVYVAGAALLWLTAGELLSGPAVRLLFGEAYNPAAPLLRILLLANALVFCNHFVTGLLLIFDRLKRHALNQMACLTIAGILSYIFIQRFGATGAAWVLVATEGFLLVISVSALPPLETAARHRAAIHRGQTFP